MKILIISNFFYPQIRIASFRIEAFAKYFHNAGFEVIVITEGDSDTVDIWNGCQVHYVKNPAKLTKIVFNDQDSVLIHNIKALINTFYNQIFLDKRRAWRLKVLKMLKIIVNNENIDIVLSSYGYLSPHLLSLKLKSYYPSCKWIADMRDEMSANPFLPSWISFRLKRIERKILDNADLVLSVSKPILQTFSKNCIKPTSFLEIKNGYDFQEYKKVDFQDEFTLSYVGSFYGAIRPDNLMKALSELKQSRRISSNFKFKIVGNSKPIDISTDLRDNIEQYPRIPHDQAIEKMKEADVLLIIYPKGRKGVYTGKLFDYLAINRIILAIVDPKDVIAEILKETNAGYAVDIDDLQGIENMIEKCYTLWKERKTIQRNWENVQKYSREKQVGILLDYIKSNWVK